VKRKPELKTLSVGDIVIFHNDCFVAGDGPWMGTILEKRGTEQLNPRTGRWRNALKVFIQLRSTRDGTLHDQWVWDTDWNALPYELVSSHAD
jgi:hypothetical protein